MQHQTPPNEHTNPSLLDRPCVETEKFCNAAIAFLQRSDLKGGEVPAFSEVWNVVQAIADGTLRLIDRGHDAAIRTLEERFDALQDERDQLMEAYHACPEIRALAKKYHADKLPEASTNEA